MVGLVAPAFLILVLTLTSFYWAPRAYRMLDPDPLSSHRQSYALYKNALARYESEAALLAAENARRIARQQRAFWEQLTGIQFEQELADLLRSLGHEVRAVGGAGDEGIDLWMDGSTIIQCKAHASSVAPHVVRDLLGARTHVGARRAVLAAPKGFTPGTMDFARKNGIELWDADYLVGLQKNLQKPSSPSG